MKAGTVVTSEFPGALYTKRRPAVVVSGEQYHRERPDVILALVTTQIHKSNSSTDYILQNWLEAGLAKPSAVRMFLFTLPKEKVVKIGQLSEGDWSEVEKRVRVAFDL